jgi:tetratricopeptide (TPR) repeat protein
MTSKKERQKIQAQAEKYIKRGKIPEAISEYQKLLSGDEQDISIRNLIGDLYVKSDQKEKAIHEFQKIADIYEEKGLYSKSIACFKRIIRLDAEDFETCRRLAKLYETQGFSSEAKVEYKKLAQALAKRNKIDDAVEAYESLLKLSPKDMKSRSVLAELYKKAGETDRAVEEMNKVAEFKMRENDLEGVDKILEEARSLQPEHSRTLANLINLYKKQDKKKESLELINETLKKDPENSGALYILGNFHLEEGKIDKAEEVFSKIIASDQKEVEAKVKLGKIYVQKDRLDDTFDLFNPVVDKLVRKRKTDQAIGLLGLILSRRLPHLRTLEKLAEVYRYNGQKNNLETVLKILLQQYKEKDLKDNMFAVAGELLNLFPENETYYQLYNELKDELGVTEEGGGEAKSLPLDEAEAVIESTMAKVDLYLEQGLIKNAKRMLDELRVKFPENSDIKNKMQEIEEFAEGFQEEDIAGRVRGAHEKETEIFGEPAPKSSPPTKKETSSVEEQESAEEKLTAADIFAETDIVPVATNESDSKQYYDLSDRIQDEQEAIKAIYNYQLRGDTTIVEKALSDIVSEFRKALDEKVDQEDYDSHYNLGIAFLEQGLMDEAIEECKLAAQSDKLVVDSSSIISFCYRQKKEFEKAMEWINKALELAAEGSEQSFALKYDLASLYEDMGETEKSLNLYREIMDWNDNYRDAAEKVEELSRK